MTDRAAFSDIEWELLVRLPRWVVTAASAAENDGVLDTTAEDEVGLIAVAKGRESGNQLVVEISDQLTFTFDDPSPAAPDFADTATGIAGVLEQARNAVRLLDAKADAADASAYRHWLLAVADMVIGAARTGGVFGVGGERVTKAERQFRDDLAHAIA